MTFAGGKVKSMENALLVRVNAKDNVAIIVKENGVKEGTVLADGVVAMSDIPQSHKVALEDLSEGDSVIRYGVVIGYAKEPISKGCWINEHMLNLPSAPELDRLDCATAVPEPEAPLTGLSFMGFKNDDGSVGTKNLLGIIPTVQCVEGVLNLAVKELEKLLPNYPNVDGIMPVNHSYGCGVAIKATEAHVPIRILRNLSSHPNFGGELLVVGLGCEKLTTEILVDGLPIGQQVILQEEQGFKMMLDTIVFEGVKILERLNRRARQSCDLSDLVVGLQCGGSDAFSGVTANPAVGYAADLLVRAGATVLFSEVTEVRDGIHLLTPRVVNKALGAKMIEEMRWYDNYLEMGGVDRDANPTPGNKEGGLANIVEKSLGSIAKSGSSAIVDVLSPGEKVRKKGLVFAATPSSDFVCGSCQLASGIVLQVFTTGRGTPYGLKMAPVIKVASRTEAYNHWNDLFDIDAGGIATGSKSIEEVGTEIFKMIIEVASGHKKVWADYWGIENSFVVFNPAPIT